MGKKKKSVWSNKSIKNIKTSHESRVAAVLKVALEISKQTRPVRLSL